MQDGLHTGKAFAEQGVQIAAGVPLQIGESANYKSFRIGLFGIDKLKDVDSSRSRVVTPQQSVRACLRCRTACDNALSHSPGLSLFGSCQTASLWVYRWRASLCIPVR